MRSLHSLGSIKGACARSRSSRWFHCRQHFRLISFSLACVVSLREEQTQQVQEEVTAVHTGEELCTHDESENFSAQLPV